MTTKTTKTLPAHRAQRAHPPTKALALVPATLLPYRAEWQRLANELPGHSVLLCFPRLASAAEQRTWEVLVSRMVGCMSAAGYHVFVLHYERFLHDLQDVQGIQNPANL